MFNAKLIAFLLSLRALFMPCCPGQKQGQIEHYDINRFTKLARGLEETSALEHAGEGTFWTIMDSGAPATLYRISSDGRLLDSLSLELPNKDWEELARDSLGNLYIGDFGNNLNRRKDLRVFKVNPGLHKTDTIAFHWEDQTNFPPGKKEMNYDCEAFFWHQQQLHFFTKSRGDGLVRHYVVPDQPGAYSAKLLESAYVKDLVTAADISPDGKKLVLLTYGKLYFFDVLAEGNMLQQAIGCIRIPWAGQSESVLFLQNNSLLLGNETRKLIYVQFNH